MEPTPARELADFLRTRRSRLRPEDLGLEPGGRRRVSGLRREELALLAGVSTDYYQRSEQGRDVRPSDEVLDGIAGALMLSAEEARHLRTLAGAVRRPVRRRRRAPEVVPAATRRLLDMIAGPAVVVGRHLDLLAWNPLADVLLGGLHHLPPRERNLLWLLLDPDAGYDRTCPERWATAAELTAMLRSAVDTDPDHPRAVELVGELAVHSAEFRTLWARHDVGEATRGRMRLDHPLVGELTLDWDAYPLPGRPGPMLVTYTAEAGSPHAERLHLLAALVGSPPSTPVTGVAPPHPAVNGSGRRGSVASRTICTDQPDLAEPGRSSGSELGEEQRREGGEPVAAGVRRSEVLDGEHPAAVGDVELGAADGSLVPATETALGAPAAISNLPGSKGFFAPSMTMTMTITVWLSPARPHSGSPSTNAPGSCSVTPGMTASAC